MDRARLKEIRERCNKATAGPLLEREDYDYYHGGTYLGTQPYYYDAGKEIEGFKPNKSIAEYFRNDVCRIHGSDEDKEFFKMAQSDMMELLEYVEKLEMKVKVRDRSLDELDKKIDRILNRLP